MKMLVIFLVTCFVFMQCNDDAPDSSCTTYATVRDLTGLDGCGFVFELEDGSTIEPILPTLFCGTPLPPKEITEDPLYGFEFAEGKVVKISYKETKRASICMVGPMAEITCITEVAGPEE
jgi:hypothetical protein